MGNWYRYIFIGDNFVKIVYVPFWEVIYSKRKEFAPLGAYSKRKEFAPVGANSFLLE